MSQWQKIVPVCDRILLWGAGDQARVNKPILEGIGYTIVALIDDTPGLCSPFSGIPLIRGWDDLCNWMKNSNTDLGFVIAIGNPFGHVRRALHKRLVANFGLKSVSFADKTALISSSASFDHGLQVMPQALIHNNARIDTQCIVNTRALVEHDCELEAGVEIGPGAVLCGRVHVGANSWIGAGATIKQRVQIGKNCIIGAGAVVVCDIPDGVIAVGVPAKPCGKFELPFTKY